MQLISNQTSRRLEFYQTGLNYDGRVMMHSSHFTMADLNLSEKKKERKKNC